MARALMGHIGSAKDEVLALEVVRLRRRVRELEDEITRLRAARAAELDIELHRLASGAEPALA